MKVDVAVLGRFHAFDLARELERHGALARLFTSYPAAKAAAFGVSREKVAATPAHELLNRASQRVASWTGYALDGRRSTNAAFDNSVAARLRAGADVFLGWSGSSTRSLARARELGMLALVERGSSHILHQRDVLRAEYEQCGVAGRLPHPGIVERELADYERADRIVVPTRFAARTFVERGVPAERLIQVPYGVSLERFRPAERPFDGPFTIVHCGAVSLRKGCHHLLRAFDELALPGARLRFVGPVAPEMEPWVRRAGAGVSFEGRLPQSELVHVYQRSSVFCLASLEEGLAMVIPQAMACGLPVVATRASGAEEVVVDGAHGRLFDAGDADALKALLLAMYADGERRAAMGRAAVERVRRGFSWRDYGDRIVAAYASALEAGVEAAA